MAHNDGTRIQRPSAPDVIGGLATTSAKIRALAQAGYDRSEIANLLGIRYQHVRKVLIDAGITTGVRRLPDADTVDRGPGAVESDSAPREATSWDVLLQSGFQYLGEWVQSSEGEFALNATAPAAPGVYAFVVDDAVAYVGLTNNGLRTRFDQYRRGHEGQRTNARVKKLIAEVLVEGKQVKILIATPPPLQWNGLPVNTAAGLEAGLIDMIQPPWNIKGLAVPSLRL